MEHFVLFITIVVFIILIAAALIAVSNFSYKKKHKFDGNYFIVKYFSIVLLTTDNLF